MLTRHGMRTEMQEDQDVVVEWVPRGEVGGLTTADFTSTVGRPARKLGAGTVTFLPRAFLLWSARGTEGRPILEAFARGRDARVASMLAGLAAADGLSSAYVRKPLLYAAVRERLHVLPDEIPDLTLPSCELLLTCALHWMAVQALGTAAPDARQWTDAQVAAAEAALPGAEAAVLAMYQKIIEAREVPRSRSVAHSVRADPPARSWAHAGGGSSRAACVPRDVARGRGLRLAARAGGSRSVVHAPRPGVPRWAAWCGGGGCAAIPLLLADCLCARDRSRLPEGEGNTRRRCCCHHADTPDDCSVSTARPSVSSRPRSRSAGRSSRPTATISSARSLYGRPATAAAADRLMVCSPCAGGAREHHPGVARAHDEAQCAPHPHRVRRTRRPPARRCWQLVSPLRRRGQGSAEDADCFKFYECARAAPERGGVVLRMNSVSQRRSLRPAQGDHRPPA